MNLKPKIGLNKKIVQGKGNIVSDMDGEKVMMSIQKGKYYNLGKMGGRIWEMLQAPTTISEISQTLLNTYLIGQQECEEQISAFLEHLYEEDLIELVEQD